MLMDAVLSAVANLVVLVSIPLLIYYVYHRKRHQRGWAEVLQRAGIQVGERRYIGYSVAIALGIILVLLLSPFDLEPFTREGSAQKDFFGLGLTGMSVLMALLYGMVETGFAEEVLFRGLIAGSLGRRLSLLWANLLQALIFLLPHLLILFIMPEMWPVLVLVFLAALLKGWIRIRSGSIIGPWLIHGLVNMTMALNVAFHTAP